MRLQLTWMVALFFATLQFSFAQERSISGTVTDESGIPLPGVAILVKESTKGTQTDFDGNYQISVQEGKTLVFSYVGMKSEEKRVGANSVINVVLKVDAQVLDDVVVTALGLEKKKDDDLSSTTVVDTEDLQRSGESGVIQSLSGKTSGVNITRNSGDPGAGAYIQIRGQNTILGSNSPLIVVDGVITSNSSVGGGPSGVVQQSRLNDLNPEDIASVSVLKGVSAAAVYGTGAANGVIVITTKRGKKGLDKKWTVNIKTAVSMDQVNREWKKQSMFGQGYGGKYNPNTGLSYGDLISKRKGGADVLDQTGEYFESVSGKKYYPIKQRNSKEVYNDSNRDAIFKKGYVFDNSVSVGYSGENSSSYFSLSNWSQTGIFKGNSDYNRTTVKFNNETSLSKKVTVKFSSSYSGITSNRLQKGSNLNGLYLGYLRTSPDFDIRDYVGTHYDKNGIPTPNSQRSYRKYLGAVRTFDATSGVFSYSSPAYDNPLWVMNQHQNKNDVNRFIIAPEVKFDIFDNLSLYTRYGLDFYQDNRQTYLPPGSASSSNNGSYGETRISELNQTYNIFLVGNHEYNNFSFGYTAGVSLQEYKYDRLSGNETNFTNPDETFLNIGNAVSENSNPGSYKEKTRQSGAYAILNFDLWNQFLVELTGRGEYLSTTPSAGLVFFPSASVGWNFTDYIKSNVFSFGKIRTSYGEIGVGPQPYATNTYYTTRNISSSWGDGYSSSLYGNPNTRSGLLGNKDLSIERKKEFEVGFDTRFFNNRLSLSATYYSNTIEGVVLNLPVPKSTGFDSQFQNAGNINNKGLEIDLSGKIINTPDFQWDLRVNFSKNKNIVESLAGVDYLFLSGFTGTSSGVSEGKPFAVLRGGVYNRDANGKMTYTKEGFPEAASNFDFIGDPNPDWKGGLGTTISYKGLTLSAFLETSQGNDVWNGTKGVLNFFGVSEETAVLTTASRDLYNAGGDLITKGTEFRGYEKDFGAGPVAVDYTWWMTNGGGFGEVSEPFVEDGSWVKLREITLSYSLPKNWLSSIGASGASLSVSGRNLYTWSKVEGFDPETNLTGASKGRGLEYFNNPGTKSIITTLRINF